MSLPYRAIAVPAGTPRPCSWPRLDAHDLRSSALRHAKIAAGQTSDRDHPAAGRRRLVAAIRALSSLRTSKVVSGLSGPKWRALFVWLYSSISAASVLSVVRLNG